MAQTACAVLDILVSLAQSCWGPPSRDTETLGPRDPRRMASPKQSCCVPGLSLQHSCKATRAGAAPGHGDLLITDTTVARALTCDTHRDNQ